MNNSTARPVPVDEHREAVRALITDAPIRRLALEECVGLVVAEDVPAGIALPPFDNSAMDGYAVRSVDVAKASEAGPVVLPVTADIPAGRSDIPPLEAGSAHRIMTGAPIPSGADTIVKVEDTDAGTDRVVIGASAVPGQHIRRAGSDIESGTIALRAGTVLSPAHLGLAAAVGLDALSVRGPMRVLVVSTGSELITAPNPLKHGQIYESNSVMLAAALRELGCEVDVLRSVADDVEKFHAALRGRLAGVDLIVTSGGVSAGAYEVVKDALDGQGVRFTKVAMQPGGPQGCGHYAGVPIVTLPGNPVSVLVSYEVFLRPAVLAALGHTVVDRPAARARLLEPLRAPGGKRQFRRGYYTPAEGDGSGRVTGTVGPRGGPSSHLLAAFTQANCLIVIPEEVTDAAEGDEVDVLLLK